MPVSCPPPWSTLINLPCLWQAWIASLNLKKYDFTWQQPRSIEKNYLYIKLRVIFLVSFVYWYKNISKLFIDKKFHWNNNNLTSLAVEIADDLGLECFSSLPPSDGLLSAARGIFGDVLGLLFVEEGWDDIRGKEAVLCVMVCTAGRLRGVRVLPETKMITSIRVHSHLRFIRRELLHELFSPRNHEKLVHNPLLNFSVNVKVDQIVILNAPTYNSTTHYYHPHMQVGNVFSHVCVSVCVFCLFRL